MCEYCTNGWVNTVKFFVSTEKLERVDLDMNNVVEGKLTPEDGKCIPVPYEFGERCTCRDADFNGSTDYIFQKSLIGKNMTLVDNYPFIFVDDRLFYRDVNKGQTKRVKNVTLTKTQIAKILGVNRYHFTVRS